MKYREEIIRLQQSRATYLLLMLSITLYVNSCQRYFRYILLYLFINGILFNVKVLCSILCHSITMLIRGRQLFCRQFAKLLSLYCSVSATRNILQATYNQVFSESVFHYKSNIYTQTLLLLLILSSYNTFCGSVLFSS